MHRIVEQKINFYLNTVNNKPSIMRRLNSENISILTGFANNIELVRDFYTTFL